MAAQLANPEVELLSFVHLKLYSSSTALALHIFYYTVCVEVNETLLGLLPERFKALA